MKIHRNKKQLLGYYMLGFLIGILYANFIGRQYTGTSGIFDAYFLHQYAQTEVIAADYMWYIMGIRVVPLILFCILGMTRFRKWIAAGALIFAGFSSGMMGVTSVMQLGIRGIFLCLVGMTPQFFFYLLAYAVLLWHFYSDNRSKFEIGKAVFVGLIFAIGMVLEGYVNPVLMKLFIKTL
ncbi:MAG: stage II sporulation protein M [Lachnospiraceae bacterium]